MFQIKVLRFSAKDDLTPVHVALHWPQPSVCPEPQPIFTLYITLFTKCAFFYNFHHKNVMQIQIHLGKQILKTVKLCPIKSKVNSPLKMSIFFPVSLLCLSMVLNWCCLLLKSKYAMHDGQDLRHPLGFQDIPWWCHKLTMGISFSPHPILPQNMNNKKQCRHVHKIVFCYEGLLGKQCLSLKYHYPR